MTTVRRGLRRYIAAGLGVSLVLTLAACGDDDDDAGSTTPAGSEAPADTAAVTTPGSDATTAPETEATDGTDTTDGGVTTDAPAAPEDMDPDGVLRIGTGLDIIGGTTFDPTLSQIISSEEWMKQVYGTLLRRLQDGSYEPWMAESVETIDETTVTVHLRDGVVFSDGAPYDADAVKASMLRTMNESTDTAKAGQNGLFRSIGEITVESPTQLTFHLNTPFAGDFYQVLAGRESMIVSPTADPTQLGEHPVGAGPFLLTEYSEMQHLVMEKSPTYWDADNVHVAGLEFIQTPAGAPRSNALLSGAVDVIYAPSTPDLAQFEAAPYDSESIIRDFGYIFFDPCSTKPPFDDPNVRHAMQIGFDREAMNELFLQGRGEVALGFWPTDNPKFNPEVEEYVTYDPEAAKQLIEDAGIAGTTVDVYYPSTLGYDQLAEIIRSQAEAMGLNFNMVPSADVVAEFIEPQKPGLLLIPGSRTGTDKYLRIFGEGQVQNLCGASRPEMLEIVNPIGAVAPDSEESIELNHAVELEIAKNGWMLPLIYSPTNFAWNTDVVGGEMKFGGQQLMYDLTDVYVKN
ncbi:MAG: ABC transporter substrate-binding protein [Ilumatobacteraceae bacterium]